ncbi:hypothetical protein D0A37_26580 [Microcoleus vaginatus HSN003]|nr:hypothetical protein D0A37_26580 [Microcoleus vaginatus HSN003]
MAAALVAGSVKLNPTTPIKPEFLIVPHSLGKCCKSSALILLLNQFKSPIILVLIFAAVL